MQISNLYYPMLKGSKWKIIIGWGSMAKSEDRMKGYRNMYVDSWIVLIVNDMGIEKKGIENYLVI